MFESVGLEEKAGVGWRAGRMGARERERVIFKVSSKLKCPLRSRKK